uniref:Pyruvate dehydrogenase E1 component subunit alpha n=1 Tax=Pterocladiophila hemisphaerica TaxID=2712948 RepID=A0A6M3WWE2_9FLOR|nr:odpA [Pterocladiophila hemisphaerica]
MFPCNRNDNRQDLLSLYKDMYLGRKFEDMCAKMYYKGKMFGFVHLYTGQEAISTGLILLLNKEDYVCSTYRDHVHALSKGVPAKLVMAELFGKETGCCHGYGGSMHLFSSQHNFVGGFAFIAEGIPVALGISFNSVYQKEVLRDLNPLVVTACFLGDGATNNGQFFECLNMSVLWKLPLIFVVENNQWAIGLSYNRTSSTFSISKKALSFGLPAIEVDGMNVLSVRRASQLAIRQARSGLGPTLIEAITYRFRGHSLADPDELRSRLEKKAWLMRDPICLFKNILLHDYQVKEYMLQQINDFVFNVIKESIDFAEKSKEPSPIDLFKYLFE